MNSLKELSQIREEVRKIKVELQNCQHIRKVSGKENDEEDEDPMVRNAEKTLSNLLVQREEQLNANIEMCHVALIDFKSFAQQWTEAKNGLENAFQVNHEKFTLVTVLLLRMRKIKTIYL